MTMKGSKDLDLVDQSSEASASYQEEMDDVDEETTTIGASKNGVVNRTHSDNVREIEGWFHKETKRVRLSRSLFMLSLLSAAAVVIALSYAAYNNTDREAFNLSFEHAAATIQSSAQYQLREATDANEGLGRSMNVVEEEISTSWPYVTAQKFELGAQQWLDMANADFMSFLPLVLRTDLDPWSNYSESQQGWIDESFVIDGTQRPNNDTIPPQVFKYELVDDAYVPVAETVTGAGTVSPLWQTTPPPQDVSVINYNAMSASWFQTPYTAVAETLGTALGDSTGAFAYLNLTMASTANPTAPSSLILSPIFQSLKGSDTIVGLVWTIVEWAKYLETALPSDINGVVAVLKNTCDDEEYSFEVNGRQATLLGSGDMHDEVYDINEYVFNLKTPATVNATNPCIYSFYLYPTPQFEENFITPQPLTAALVSGAIFLVLLIAFALHEMFVEKKVSAVVDNAARTNGILTTLFPANVRERLLEEQMEREKKGETHHDQIKKLLSGDEDASGSGDYDDGDDDGVAFDTKPIADLFTDTTILFADIVGFTAWSSVREPAQVFTLLETLYHAFDKIADRRRVFKVETVGDCYVAVTGLPEPRSDHAVVMARFANECLYKMFELTRKLEVELGPDTGDLSMRFGLHSGAVTAGVLRGKRSRFQLFGDTMNTASRMETTSTRGRIQVSQDTADLLVAAGKSHWISRRDELVFAKGKGEMQTYWLNIGQSAASTVSGGSINHSESDDFFEDISEEQLNKQSRLVDWNVEVLRKLLKQIAARREFRALDASRAGSSIETSKDLVYKRDSDKTILDEVSEVIALPKFDSKAAKRERNPNNIKLGQDVESQLHNYVRSIACMYRENPFHNFEHVSHVVMSVTKLLSRIVAPAAEVVSDGQKKAAPSRKKKSGDKDIDRFMNTIAHDAIGSYVGKHKTTTTTKKKLHDHTYGITSDPLTQFACVFSALIHDVDHSGVPNTQLAKEQPVLASMYKEKSVAEQVSVDLAWNLLMEDSYSALRNAIFQNHSELYRFRKLVVNSVMATDVMDKDLKELRNARWAKAFSEARPPTTKEQHRELTNRKATIVIEHIIQASDVSHTMQHWHVYREWNEKLFREMSYAYHEGRAETDPATFWYKGEIGFFDFYIIPLARKLKDCGVFGVSSSEYLNYALMNRKEWELKGQAVVEEMVENFRKEMEERESKKAPVPAPMEESTREEDNVNISAVEQIATEGRSNEDDERCFL